MKADQSQIEQVIVNLAVNARDAMPDGGKLIIAATNHEVNEKEAEQMTYVQPGSYVQLTVTDTGIGMDANTMAHLRALLHHQGERQGHGTRARHGLRYRQAERRLYLGV